MLLDSSKLGNYLSIKEFANSIGVISVIVNTLEGEQVYVWGANYSGVLGIGNKPHQSSPVLFNTKQFGNYVHIKKIEFGKLSFTNSNSSYAILSTVENIDKIYVWGQNDHGQLGIGNANGQTTPVLFDTTQFGTIKNIKEFDIFLTSHAIIQDDKNNEKIYLWGRNTSGECATGDTSKTFTPIQLSFAFNPAKIKFITIKYDSFYLVLTRNGIDELWAWGNNTSNQIIMNSSNAQTSPIRISQSALGGATEIISINSFGSALAQVRVNGILKFYAWGLNNEGQLGVGSQPTINTPTEINFGENILEVYDSSFNSNNFAEYSSFAYARTVSGDRLYVWGSNQFGQLGLGNTQNALTPNLVNNLNLSTGKIKNFSKRQYNTFSLTLDRNGQSESYAAGYNAYGQLGNGNTTNVSSFIPILPIRYTNPRSKVIPTTNLTSSEALELINPNNTLNRTELEKYVDITTNPFPAGATLSIDPATTTSDYKNGILNLGIKTNQYNVPMVLATQTDQKTFNVNIPGFRPVTDINTNPVTTIIRDADGNNIDKIYDQLVDSTYKVINRDLLEYYFDLSSIPPNAVIHLYRTSFGNDTEATFTLTSSQVYGNNGLIVSNQLYVKTDLVWTFTSSQLNLALVISLSVVGGLLLIGAIIAIMLVRRSSNRLII